MREWFKILFSSCSRKIIGERRKMDITVVLSERDGYNLTVRGVTACHSSRCSCETAVLRSIRDNEENIGQKLWTRYEQVYSNRSVGCSIFIQSTDEERIKVPILYVSASRNLVGTLMENNAEHDFSDNGYIKKQNKDLFNKK